MLLLVTCMGGMDVDTGHMHERIGCWLWSHAWEEVDVDTTDHIAREEWMLTLITCMGGVDVDTCHMHGRSGC